MAGSHLICDYGAAPLPYVVRGLETCDQLVNVWQALVRGHDLARSAHNYALAGYGTEHLMLNYWFLNLHVSVSTTRAASV